MGTLFVRNFILNEKKISHRIELPYGVGDPAFKRSLGQLLGPPLVDGNRVSSASPESATKDPAIWLGNCSKLGA